MTLTMLSDAAPRQVTSAARQVLHDFKPEIPSRFRTYLVSRRTREIGVRVALGARSRHVLAMILSQGLRSALTGIVPGIARSLALTRAIQSLLFGATATDPLTFSAVTPASALCRVAGLLHPRPPRGQGRPHGGAEIRVRSLCATSTA